MPALKCTVTDCQHNSQECCCLGHIDVGGQKAKESRSTCCESFDNKCQCPTDVCEQPKGDASIHCDATNCTYNESCQCHADSVQVEGCDCTTCRETACATFCCR